MDNEQKCYNYIKQKFHNTFLDLKPSNLNWCDYYQRLINFYSQIINNKISYSSSLDDYVKNLFEFHVPSYFFSKYSLSENSFAADKALKLERFDILNYLASKNIYPSSIEIQNSFISGSFEITQYLATLGFTPSQQVLDILSSNGFIRELKFWWNHSFLFFLYYGISLAAQHNHDYIILFAFNHNLYFDPYSVVYFSLLNLNNYNIRIILQYHQHQIYFYVLWALSQFIHQRILDQQNIHLLHVIEFIFDSIDDIISSHYGLSLLEFLNSNNTPQNKQIKKIIIQDLQSLDKKHDPPLFKLLLYYNLYPNIISNL